MKQITFGQYKRDNPLKFRRVKKILKKITPIFLIVAILTLLSIFLISQSGSKSVVNFILNSSGLRSSGGRVNVLLLGIAGGNHDGANLTDTIMVASYNLQTNKLYLISIPRDLWLPSLQSKANAAYEIGLGQKNGLGFARTIMGNILGLSIQYGLRLDFRGFVQAVDTLGGIDVAVEKTFDDLNFPIEGKENDLCGYLEKEIDFSDTQAKELNIPQGKMKVVVSVDGKIATDSAQEDAGAKYFTCRYEHIHFDKGLIHMDGATALKFVRSRHGTNGESSDFARSKRQELVLQAIRNKVLSFETLANPQKISDLIKALGKSVDTDISAKNALDLYNKVKKLDKTISLVLDDSQKIGLPNGRTSLLIHPNQSDYGGAYVLVSQDDDFSTVQNYVRKVLTGEIKLDEASSSARSGN